MLRVQRLCSVHDLAGNNPDGNMELFLYDTTVNEFTQITDTTGGGEVPHSGAAMTPDGSVVAFTSDRGLAGGSEGPPQIFLYDTGSMSFTQITDSGTGNVDPAINSDASLIAFRSSSNRTMENPDLNFELFLYDVAADDFTQVTDTIGDAGELIPTTGSDGTFIAFSSTADITGDNPDGNSELFVHVTGPSPPSTVQLTNITTGDSIFPSMNSEEDRIVFQSTSDITGNNTDGNRELFTVDEEFTQITDQQGFSRKLFHQ